VRKEWRRKTFWRKKSRKNLSLQWRRARLTTVINTSEKLRLGRYRRMWKIGPSRRARNLSTIIRVIYRKRLAGRSGREKKTVERSVTWVKLGRVAAIKMFLLGALRSRERDLRKRGLARKYG